MHGYLLDASPAFAVLHPFHDFNPEGYSIIRTADIVEVRSGPGERLWDRMLAGEGKLDGLTLPIQVDLSTIRAVIESIDRAYGRMIVECEDLEEDIEDFYIGTVAEVDDSMLVFNHFDGFGEWAQEPGRIDLSEITVIQFATPYIDGFWKYLPETAPGHRFAESRKFHRRSRRDV